MKFKKNSHGIFIGTFLVTLKGIYRDVMYLCSTIWYTHLYETMQKITTYYPMLQEIIDD